MLSKSRGEVFRLATVMHMLFSIDSVNCSIPEEILEIALKAAVNFVQTACQQTAYIAGRETFQEELQKFKAGTCTYICTSLKHAPW